MRTVGAVDIGGTKIAVGVVSEDGSLLCRSECPTDPGQGFAAAMKRVKAMLHKMGDVAGGSFSGIGVACPGPLDPIAGVIGEVGTLPGWEGGELSAELEREFGVSVAVENDADAATLAEAKLGAGIGSTHLIYLTVSTGIGAGILLNGNLYRGASGAHPEIGHWVLDASAGTTCYCKASGCWESLASGEAIAAWVQQQAPVAEPLTAAQIAQRAESGEPQALKAMERQGYYLGLGLANLITAFIPQTIVLGGGVMKSQHLFLPRALATVHEICTQVPAGKTRILTAALGADTGVAGAAQAWLLRYGSG